ncbi:MAG: MFS transporter [Verrucomicrobia bacterium]|jgi:Na+/melibiose symporter-like transporter|nr:MFS transporter [Verrucomicrobiota bacterium]
MIVTCKGRIPFLWILFAALPWSAGLLKFLVMGNAFIFSLKKFVDNPAGLTFVMSLPGILSLGLRPFINFMSDRVWTRFGRRKPFVINAWVGCIVCIGLMPVMPNFWLLLACYIGYNIFNDLGEGPMEALKQEVVPPRQRGTSTAIGTWIFNFALLTFNLVAIGRFDDYKFMAGVPLTGEQSIYWSTCAAMLMMLLLIMLGIRELEQQSKLRGERFSLGNFFRGILNRNLWPVYLLITGFGILNAGLGPMGALLYVDQWQFTKQEMGYNFVIGGTLNVFIIALVAIFADKLPRMRAYQVLMVLFMVINFSFYLYVHHVLYDRTPTLVELVVFGETLSIIGILMGMIYTPLVYDYVPRNEMGTYAAGAALTGRITSFLTLNGVGLFIWAHATLFLPPGGEMTRVTFSRPHSNAEVGGLITSSGLATHYPGQRLTAEAWYATRAALDQGRGFELRAKNPDSVKLKAKRDKLDAQRSTLIAKQRNAEGFAERRAQSGDVDGQQRYLAQAEELKASIAPLTAQVEAMDAELTQRAQQFRDQVAATFGPRLLRDGDQLRAGFVQPILIFDYALNRRPDSDGIERTLNVLRQARPDVVDLRLIRRPESWALAVSLESPSPVQPEQFGRDLGNALAQADAGRLDGALALPPVPVAVRDATSVGLDVLILEDPLNRHPSPITRVVYRILNVFTDAPTPERRIWATARALRVPGVCEHAGVRVAADGDHAIRVVAVYEKPPGGETNGTEHVTAAVAGRLEYLLAGQPAGRLDEATDLYRRLIPAASQNRTTIARPWVTAGFATMKYDYMSGYIWMLLLGFGALAITIMFVRREARGLIHKRGREEADAEKAAEDQAADEEVHGHPEAVKHYTPGFFWAKLGMIGFALLLIAAALVKIGPDLRLMLFGARAQAEAVRVVKEKIGGATQVFTTDAEVRAAEEKQDRSYVFWNEYRFQRPDGTEVEFRAPAGSQLRPAQYLTDKDGLPTTVAVWYDPAHPQTATLPAEYSTWFVPGTLGGFGLLGLFTGGVLLYHARKKIPLPVLPGQSAPAVRTLDPAKPGSDSGKSNA